MAQHPLRIAILSLALLTPTIAFATQPVTLTHSYGLVYSADGRQLIITSDQGLAIHSGGRWSTAAGAAHEFKSLAASRDALISSGHPAPESNIADPMGLIKSTDGGKTWRKLGLHGESDFHTLAASLRVNVVYASNRQPNSRMGRTGIHYTLDNGVRWRRAEAKGLGGPIHQLAAHPSDPRMVAAASDAGLYFSRNHADTFHRLGDPGFVLAVSFDVDGEHVWFSGYSAEKPSLRRIRLTSGATADDVALPLEDDDAVARIAQNPVRSTEIAIATFKRNVFVSHDLGKTWVQIAFAGTTTR
ncbi:F510_1955 family glycosylhydrolase [Hydrogenophaga sp.]|uniref:F510_1955 family glycosylhydrolase n=1 Tax=Hydrogenophaga sp. TaxID=1904254 RepID=UPI0025B9DD48|nr:glycosyl hydrolase [Hydrogenophaga sp.]